MDKPLHLNKEWLKTKYLDEGLSTYDIAKIVHRDPKRVYEKLKDFGIPTRPRGLNLKGADNYMKQPGKVNPFLGRKHSAKTRAILRSKASVPKPYLRGKRNGMFGRCGEENPNYIDGRTPERQRLYASSQWKKIKRNVYSRDNFTCRRCEKKPNGVKELHTHHLVPWDKNIELRLEPNNIITVCRSCHEWIHSKANINQEFLHLIPRFSNLERT